MRSGEQKENPQTFRQQLDAINFPDDQIPTQFIDHYVSHDIMQNPVIVSGITSGEFIMDHASMAKFNLQKLQAWDKRTQGGTLFYDARQHPGFASIGGGQDGMSAWEHHSTLRKEIEAWVTKKVQEAELVKKEEEEARIFMENLLLQTKKREEEKARQIQKIEAAITQANQKINLLLDPECALPEPQKEAEIQAQLAHIDSLNKSESKLVLGVKYYDKPEVLEYEIKRLQAKQDAAALVDEEIRDLYFSKEDQDELNLCYRQLDSHTLGRIPGARYFRPGLFELLPAQFNSSVDIPIMDIPRLAGNGEEQ